MLDKQNLSFFWEDNEREMIFEFLDYLEGNRSRF